MFPKALACGADIVCVELEDGIAPKDKAAARVNAMALFTEPQADDGVERIVRINCLREAFGLADVQAVLASDAPPPALMLPKVRTPDEVVWLDDLLSERGHDTRLHVIIETNPWSRGRVRNCPLQRSAGCLVLRWRGHGRRIACANAWEPLLYARSRVVHSAASAGLDVIDVPFLDLEDLEGMEIAARQARDLGFSGKGAIHPKQIPALNAVFTPDAAQIDRARRIIRTFEEADTGLVVIDGKLIEKPVLRDMHRILAIAERVSAGPA